MPKRERDRFTVLAPDIASPRIVAAIDKALEENQRERIELLKLREIAVSRHGDTALQSMPLSQKEPEPSIKVDQREAESLNVAILIALYKSDKDSPYRQLRYRTREHYDSMMRRIERDIGTELIRNIDAERLKQIHASWTISGAPTAHGLIGMLRGLATFGATTLKNKECIELRFAISQGGFKAARSKVKLLTDEQILAIRKQAHMMGLHSIARAQALQFDCRLKQRDVIGEWVPLSEPGDSYVTWEGRKWLRGIRWEEIDANRVLRHIASWGQKEIEIDLKEAPMVMQEFGDGEWPKRGPVITAEATGKPWVGVEFRRMWRTVARAVGVPDDVKNMHVRFS